MNAVIALMATLLATSANAGSGEICVENRTDLTLLFAVEGSEGMRAVSELDPSELLCAASQERGVVSVFASDDAIEGCSRLVEAGKVEVLIKYAEFDRCGWSSQLN